MGRLTILRKAQNGEWICTQTGRNYIGLQNALDHVMPRYNSRRIIVNKSENAKVHDTVELIESVYDQCGEVYEGDE